MGMGGCLSIKAFFAYAFLVFLSSRTLMAQDSLATPRSVKELKDSVFSVDQIVITGNEQTKDFVILREMTMKPGALITRELLEYDKNRIYSLGLFNEVRLQAVPSSESTATLVVTLSERWFIYPYPILGLVDRDWSKIYYGLGLLHMNFRGRNEKLVTSFALGYNPWLAVSYRNPFLSEEGTYYLDARLVTNVIRNKSLQAMTSTDNFDERHYAASLTVGKRMAIAHTAWVSVGYEVITVSKYDLQTTLSPSGEDKYPLFGIGYRYDSRDLAEYPSSGSLLGASISKFGFPSDEVDITRYAADARQYIPLSSRAVLAGRMMTDLAAGGPTPSYNRVYFGYGERVRGHFREVMEGESMAGASAEFHYTLMQPVYFHVNGFPPAFSVWRFGFVATVFGDAGTAWFRGQPFVLNAFSKGYGVGMDFLLPYSAVVRVDYAWNEVRRGEFILDLGASF